MKCKWISQFFLSYTGNSGADEQIVNSCFKLNHQDWTTKINYIQRLVLASLVSSMIKFAALLTFSTAFWRLRFGLRCGCGSRDAFWRHRYAGSFNSGAIRTHCPRFWSCLRHRHLTTRLRSFRHNFALHRLTFVRFGIKMWSSSSHRVDCELLQYNWKSRKFTALPQIAVKSNNFGWCFRAGHDNAGG